MMAAGALVTGCFSDHTAETPILRGQSAVTLEFEVPQAPEMEVATRSAADDAARENNIVRLDIFAFDDQGDIVAGDEGHKTMTGGITTVNGKGRAQIYVTIPPTPGYVLRQFYMVANGNDALFTGISTVDDLKAAIVSGANAMPTEEFIMSGYSSLNKIDTANPSVNMSLRRVVSRIDVVLTDAVTNFEITQVRVINARNGAYVYEHLDAENNVKTPGGSSLVNYAFVPAAEESHKRDFTSLLYAYENYDAAKDDATTTAIIIGGMYKGQEVFYRVNLHDNASQAQIRRNYVYKVRILAVNGPGNADPDGAILDAPQNIDYEIVDWDYSQHTDVVYDGKHYLGLSRSEFTFGKAASTGTANIVTNLDSGDVTISECDENGAAATWSWLDGAVSGSKVTVTAAQNDDTEPRVGYLLVQSTTKPRLKLIIKVQQYHSDDMLMMFSPSVIMAPTTASNDKTTVGTFMFPTGTQWMIESVNLLEDGGRNWMRVQSPYDNTGVWMDSGGSANVTLGFDVDAMNPEFTVRTAVVTILAKYGAMEEKKTITVSQANATEDMSLSRYYIGKTGAPAVEKIDIMSYAGWNAYFVTEEKLFSATVPTKGAVDWAYFADENYTKLPGSESHDITSTGSGSLYIVFDAVAENKDGYIIVESGGKKEAIRLKRVVSEIQKINGVETMMMPGHYQWGRVPDGYETLLITSNTIVPVANTFNASAVVNNVKRQPRYGDAAYGKIISPGTASATTPATSMEWLNVDNSITPQEQRNKNYFWDAAAVAADVLSETNLTGVKTDFDPCPDGWRVPTGRELENIFTYGPNQVDASSRYANSGSWRYIQSDEGKRIAIPLVSFNSTAAGATQVNCTETRGHPSTTYFARHSEGTSIIDTFTYWWTSSMSASGGPYMIRFWGNDAPEVMWTSVRSELGTDVRWPAKEFEPMTSMYARVRCIRDNQTREELIVNKRRTTVDYEAQEFDIELTANNIIGSWTAVSSDPSWLTIVSGNSGSGDATIRLSVTQNGQNNRNGYIRITTPSGAVANIVVRQTDYTGVKIRGVWVRDRNLGATRADHNTSEINDASTIGFMYRFGTPDCIDPKTGKGSTGGALNREYNAWNLNSQTAGSRTNFYPFGVKNEVNDPCPEGWRIPTIGEAMLTFGVWLKSPNYTTYTVGTTPYNRMVIADNGRTVCFPATGWWYNNSWGYNTGAATRGLYHTSTLGTYTSTSPYYWSAYRFKWATTGNPNYILSGSDYNVTAGFMVIRCIQDVPDDWGEYSNIMQGN